MGTWGHAIFSDDTTSDVRASYRELLEDQVADDDAARRVIEEYAHLTDESAHLLWLGLAAAQHELGRLDPDVKARALRIIDEGIGLDLWAEAGPRDLAKRRAVLTRLREKLSGEQPAPRKLHRPVRMVTDLVPGDVLAWRAPSGHIALFRVSGTSESRTGVSPVIDRLVWKRKTIPSERRLRRLETRTVDSAGRAEPDRREIFSTGKNDPSWSSLGFERVLAANGPSVGLVADARWSCQWRTLERRLLKEHGADLPPE